MIVSWNIQGNNILISLLAFSIHHEITFGIACVYRTCIFTTGNLSHFKIKLYGSYKSADKQLQMAAA